MNILIIIILAVVAVIDVRLLLAHKATISQRYQRLFPAWYDLLIMAILIPGICALHASPTLRVLLGVLAGHLFWGQRERYR